MLIIIVLYDKGDDTGVTQGAREEGSEEEHDIRGVTTKKRLPSRDD